VRKTTALEGGVDRRKGWGVAVRSLLFVVFSAVLLAVASRWIPGTLKLACACALGTLLLTVLFVRWEGVGLEDVGVKLVRGSLGRFAVAFGAGLGLAFLRAGLVMMGTGLRYERVQGFTLTEALFSLATYLALASREELAFRGYPLQTLNRRFGAGTALTVISLLFAAEHALGGWTWWQALLGSGLGALLFGAAALRTRGLAVPIGLHAAWNFGDSMLGGKGTLGLWKPVVDANAIERVETAQWAIYVVVMIVATAAIWFWPRGAMKTVER
jgi:membrane protease YdiL (CAAX protease family)